MSSVHLLLVVRHRDPSRSSLSAHVAVTRRSHFVYFVTHVIVEILFVLFSYQFYLVEHNLRLPFILNINFVIFDFIQAWLPSRGKTRAIHFVSAYVSWCSFLLGGVIALVKLPVSQPYQALASLLLIPILGMFFYLHIDRSKGYRQQLLIVPLFAVYMLLIVIGVS